MLLNTCADNLSPGRKRPCTLNVFLIALYNWLIIYNVTLIFDLDTYERQRIV